MGESSKCYKIDNSSIVLETTLTMLGAEQYISEFKKNGINSWVLPLLTIDDLKVLGVSNEDLRQKIVKQCASLPTSSEHKLDTKITDTYLMNVLHEVDQHLLLLDAALCYALRQENMKRSYVKVEKVTKCLAHCVDSFQKELRAFHKSFAPQKYKKKNRWKYGLLAVVSAVATMYTFRTLLRQ